MPATRITHLPDDIQQLSALASGEGLRFVGRLIQDFRSGSNTFGGPGEALFEVRSAGKLIGIGGLNVDPYTPDGSIGRVRRMYVHPQHRGRGVGRALLDAIETHAVGRFDLLRLRTDSEAAGRFYVRAGFSALVGVAQASHGKRLRRTRDRAVVEKDR